MRSVVYPFTHLVFIILLSSFLAAHAVENISRKLCRGSSCQGRVAVTMAMHHCAYVCVHMQTSVCEGLESKKGGLLICSFSGCICVLCVSD